MLCDDISSSIEVKYEDIGSIIFHSLVKRFFDDSPQLSMLAADAIRAVMKTDDGKKWIRDLSTNEYKLVEIIMVSDKLFDGLRARKRKTALAMPLATDMIEILPEQHYFQALIGYLSFDESLLYHVLPFLFMMNYRSRIFSSRIKEFWSDLGFPDKPELIVECILQMRNHDPPKGMFRV